MTDTTASNLPLTPSAPAATPSAATAHTGARQAHVPLVAWIGWVGFIMLVAAIVPFDGSYDVAHYHIHNGWAAWNGRIDLDYAPADLHSFLNPTYNMFAWFLIERLPGPAVNAILTIPAALVFPALYYLARTLSTLITGQASRATCLAVAFVGFMAEGQFSIFASIRNDAWGAAAFLAALALVFTAEGRLANPRRLAIASLLLGGVLGMKLVNLPYVLCFGAIVLILAQGWRERLQSALVCAIAGGAAAMLLFAPHAWILWERFDNPVFPVANDIFQSPLGPTEFDTYERRRPGLLGTLIYPFVFTWDSEIIGSVDTKDARFLLTYLGAPTLLFLAWRASRHTETSSRQDTRWVRPVIALSVGLIIAMVAWMQGFSVLRYLLAAWMVGPVMAACVFWAITRQASPSGKALRYAGAVAAALLLTTNIGTARRVAWDHPMAAYVSADLGDTSRFEDAFILFTGDYPSAFLAPMFPSTATFGAAIPQDYFSPALDNYRPRLRAAIANQPDRPIFAVMFVTDDEPPFDRTSVLAKLQDTEGLIGDPATCETIDNNFDLEIGDWILCPVVRPGELALRPRWTETGELG